LTYSIEKIEILGNQKFKEKTEVFIFQRIFELNNVIAELIKIDLDTVENLSRDFRLNDLRLLLKNYINKNFSKSIFNNVCNYFRDIIQKKVNIPHKTEIEKGRKGIKISFELPEKFAKLDFFIVLNLEEEFSLMKKQLIKREDLHDFSNLNIHNTEIPLIINSFNNSKNAVNSNLITNSATAQQMRVGVSSETVPGNLRQTNAAVVEKGNTKTTENMGMSMMDMGGEAIKSADEIAEKNINIASIAADLIHNVNLNETVSNNPNPNNPQSGGAAIQQNKALLNLLNKDLEVENHLVLGFSHRILQREKPFIVVKNHKLKLKFCFFRDKNFKK